jgi:hypothetical protein
LTAAGLLVSAAGAAAPASALTTPKLNLLASSTALSGTLADNGSSISLTVTVAIPNISTLVPNLGLGVRLTPDGTVGFSDNQGDNLGAVTLPPCLLTACTATHTVPVAGLSDGVTRITASYSGDVALKPSGAALAVGLSSCSGDSDCDVVIAQGSTELEVSGDDTDEGNAYVVATLGGPALPCSLGVAPVANFDGFNLNDRKFISYSVSGAAADAYNNASDNGDAGYDDYFCWVSPDPFTAFHPTLATFQRNGADFTQFGDAPEITSGPYAGDFVGVLATCSELDSSDPSPCIDDYEYDAANVDTPTSSLFVDVNAPAGDPHAGG